MDATGLRVLICSFSLLAGTALGPLVVPSDVGWHPLASTLRGNVSRVSQGQAMRARHGALAFGKRGGAPPASRRMAADLADYQGRASPSSTGRFRCDAPQLAFRGVRLGWAVGSQGTVLVTRDGGRTWHPYKAAHGDLCGIAFLSDLEGWAVGRSGLLVSTRDGGASWSHRARVTKAHLYRVRFVSSKVGWILGEQGVILFTSDGGIHWSAQNAGVRASLRDIACFSPRECVVVGDDSAVLTTRDAGATWVLGRSFSPELDVGDDEITGLSIGPGTVWAVAGGRAGSVLRSKDRGETWTVDRGSLPMQFPTFINFWDSQNGIIVGSELVGGGAGILLTTDGAISWNPARAPRGLGFVYFAFLGNERVGWALAQDGKILSTDDRGKTWRIQFSER